MEWLLIGCPKVLMLQVNLFRSEGVWTGKEGVNKEGKWKPGRVELRMLVKGQSQGKCEEAGVLGREGGQRSEKGKDIGGWGQMEARAVHGEEMRVSLASMAEGTQRKGQKPEKLGRKNLASSMTWLLVVCGRLGSQDNSEIKWPGEKLVPFSEKVNPGPSCHTMARGALPSAPSLPLTQPSCIAFSLPFSDSSRSPTQKLQ